MCRINFFRTLILLFVAITISACDAQDVGNLKPDLSKIKKIQDSIWNIGKGARDSKNEDAAGFSNDTPLPLTDILKSSLATNNPGTDFVTYVKYALDTDPEIISKQREIEAKSAAVGAIKAQKDFQVGTTLYGGYEDVTDNTKGLALAISASRLVFDGGRLDSQIASLLYDVEASKMDLAATRDQRANELFQKWLELEKYKSLQAQIDKRLSVLNPLIDQLENCQSWNWGCKQSDGSPKDCCSH